MKKVQVFVCYDAKARTAISEKMPLADAIQFAEKWQTKNELPSWIHFVGIGPIKNPSAYNILDDWRGTPEWVYLPIEEARESLTRQ
uniref:Uncharacterized protein n=1 Tax=viral metagenome TaxID=1070528 RepID=A0A6H2A1Q1_9ZZZZ